MPQTLRVKLNSTVRQDPTGAGIPERLFAPLPDVILGGTANDENIAVPVAPSPTTLFGPRGAALLEDGTVWVADTGHHRLLGWTSGDMKDDSPAEIVIGQPDHYHEGRNAKGEVTGHSLNVPTGVAACGKGLAVADAWNHRVLIWFERPEVNNQPADVVLGQADLFSGEGNRGKDAPTAETMFWSYGVHWDGERLWVGDTGNRRVLMWNGLPQANGQPADLVLGQKDFLVRDENGGGDPNASSMRWPHSIAFWAGRLCITDAGNNRVMVWNELPTENDQPCDVIIGQQDIEAVDHNQRGYFPNERSLNMPYGIATVGDWLIVADTANSRVLGWHIDDVGTNAPARRLSGQFGFQDKGDNRWQMPARDSFCWPYGLDARGEKVLICDSGNNRVSIWSLAK